MMTYFLDSRLDSGDAYSPPAHRADTRTRVPRTDGVRVLAEKLGVPSFAGLIQFPRLHAFIQRIVEQFPATLICGRAGTGKTALASAFARSRDRAAWYSVESSDIEWNVFIHYFAACLLRGVKSKARPVDMLPTDAEPSQSSMATS